MQCTQISSWTLLVRPSFIQYTTWYLITPETLKRKVHLLKNGHLWRFFEWNSLFYNSESGSEQPYTRRTPRIQSHLFKIDHLWRFLNEILYLTTLNQALNDHIQGEHLEFKVICSKLIISEGFLNETPCLTILNQALNDHIQEEHLEFKVICSKLIISEGFWMKFLILQLWIRCALNDHIQGEHLEFKVICSKLIISESFLNEIPYLTTLNQALNDHIEVE